MLYYLSLAHQNGNESRRMGEGLEAVEKDGNKKW